MTTFRFIKYFDVIKDVPMSLLVIGIDLSANSFPLE